MQMTNALGVAAGSGAMSGLHVTSKHSDAWHAQHVAVALDDGQLFFLRMDTGACSGACNDAGGRTPPVADPWHGLIWTVSHSNELTVAAAPSTVPLLHATCSIQHNQEGL